MAGVIIVAFINGRVDAQCEQVPQWLEQRTELREQIAQLEQATPFLEQFDDVKRSVDMLHEVLQSTGGDLDEVRETIDEVLGHVGEQNEELQNVRRWARSTYSNPEWEPDLPDAGSDDLTLSGGLETASDWIGEIEGQVGQFQSALNVLEGAVHAADGRPSDQLEAFESYFRTITESLDGYAEVAPLVGIFVEMFKFYGDAIGLIRGSVERIEAEYSRRDEILRQLGPEFNNVRYHWPLSTPSERLGRQRAELQQQLDAIEKALADCDVDLDEQNPTAAPNLETEIRRARDAADRRCSQQFNVTGVDELIDRRNDALERVQRHYRRPTGPFFPAEYGEQLTTPEELDYARTRHERWTAGIGQAEHQLQQIEQEYAAIEGRFEQYRSGELSLSTEEAGALNVERTRMEEAVEHWRTRVDELQRTAETRHRDVQDALDAQQSLDDFQRCVRDWIEGLAQQMGWDPFWLHHYHGDLYRARLRGSAIPAGMGRLEVRLIDAAGLPVNGNVRVWRSNANGEQIGAYSLMPANSVSDFPAGHVVLQIYSESVAFAEWRRVRLPERRQTIERIDGFGQLRIELTSASDTPMNATARVWNTDDQGNRVGNYALTGTFGLLNLRPGTYVLDVYGGGLAFSQWRRVTIREGRRTVDQIGGLGALSTVFTNPAGDTLAATARLWHLDDSGERTGRYVTVPVNGSTNLNPGAYRMQVYSPHLAEHYWTDVTITSGATTTVRVGD